VPWHVLEVHLEEATFLWAQWEHALWAPDYVLAELAHREEQRLLAHIDALVLGGRPVAERLLLPAIQAEEPSAISTAALALLGAEDVDWRDTVLEWLAEGAEELISGIRRGVELSPREDLTPALLALVPSLPPLEQAGVLAALRFRQADASEALRKVKLGEDLSLRVQAVRSARFVSRPLGEELVRIGLGDSEPQVRDAALEEGLVLGSRQAWTRCRQLLEAGGEVPRVALLALAMGGEGKELEALGAALKDPALRDEALWALGFSGRLTAAELAFQNLQEVGDRLAAESFAAITGLPLGPPFLEEEEPDEEDFDAELFEAGAEGAEEEEEAPPPEAPPTERLPGPEVLPGKVVVDRVERWWAEARRRFEPQGRYLRGQPLTVELVRAALEGEPMRRRPVLAWELAIRSQGACQIESRTWTHVQRLQAQKAAGLRSELLVRSFDRLLSR
jgi:uncharacterized protein (TIGR02270 family)